MTDLRETYDTIEERLDQNADGCTRLRNQRRQRRQQLPSGHGPRDRGDHTVETAADSRGHPRPPPPPTTLHLLTPSTLASTLAAAASTTGLDRAGSGTRFGGAIASEQVSGSEMLSGGQGTDGGNLHDVVLLAVKGLTVPPTNTFEAGDLPPEPAPAATSRPTPRRSPQACPILPSRVPRAMVPTVSLSCRPPGSSSNSSSNSSSRAGPCIFRSGQC